MGQTWTQQRKYLVGCQRPERRRQPKIRRPETTPQDDRLRFSGVLYGHRPHVWLKNLYAIRRYEHPSGLEGSGYGRPARRMCEDKGRADQGAVRHLSLARIIRVWSDLGVADVA